MATTKELITSASEDLLVEILIRLPDHRSLFRCKSVCKIWNSLISAPYFHRRLVSRYQTLSADESESPVVTYSELRESISSFLPFPHEIRFEFSILDTYKDLVLVGFNRRGNCEELQRTHVVCNPSTKQWVALPLVPKQLPSRSPSFVNLLCEPFDSHGQLAFPCRFRVVMMHYHYPATSQVNAYLFCSRSGQWTKFVLRSNDGDLSSMFGSGVVSMNEKLYWMNSRSQVVEWDPSFGTVPTLIHNSKLDYCCYRPFVFEGALHAICYEQKGFVTVWRLEEEEGEGWSKRYEIGSSESEGVIIHDCRQVEVREWMSLWLICVHPPKAEIMFSTKYLSCCRRSVIMRWNFKKKEVNFVRLVPFTKIPLIQPRVTVWPSLIPDHLKLQKIYNGSYTCWR